jgi:hypothetical protein
MIRAFVDTSVLFAASYSSTGALRELIRLAFQGQVQRVISDDVLSAWHPYPAGVWTHRSGAGRARRADALVSGIQGC